MKIVKPKYYDAFQCIADKCPFHCCMQWDIFVDEKTLSKWSDMDLAESVQMPSRNPLDYIVEDDGAYKLHFDENKNCPYLDDNGLCKMIAVHGQECTPVACQTFPREIKEYDTHKEYSLSPGCPHVLDLLFENGFSLKNSDVFSSLMNPYIYIRQFLLDIMKNENVSLDIGLKMIFFILTNIKDEVDMNEFDDNTLIERVKIYLQNVDLSALQKALEDQLFTTGEPLAEQLLERNELLIDALCNYSKAGLYSSFVEPLNEHANELDAFIQIEDYNDYLKQNKYVKELRSLLIEEIFAELVNEATMGIEDLIISFQWLSMQYVVIRQALFLQWLHSNKNIDFCKFKQTVMYTYRIMGYTMEDVKSFMIDNFEDEIWILGYYNWLIK